MNHANFHHFRSIADGFSGYAGTGGAARRESRDRVNTLLGPTGLITVPTSTTTRVEQFQLGTAAGHASEGHLFQHDLRAEFLIPIARAEFTIAPLLKVPPASRGEPRGARGFGSPCLQGEP